MPKDPRVDSYIEKQADFARPILEHLREIAHSVHDFDETVKWGMPAFMYKGRMLAHMAGFKGHATFAFWRGDEIVGEASRKGEAMGQFGRLESTNDLPDDDILRAMIAEAMALAESGSKAKRERAAPKEPLETPPDLEAALARNSAARETFHTFTPAARRDYLEWILDSKRPETRAKRIAQAVEWMAEGKKRNWKYEKC